MRPFAALCILLMILGCEKIPPPPPPAQTAPIKIVEIPPGAGLSQVSKILKREGIIEHPRIFWLKAKALRKEKQLQAGEYDLSSSLSDEDILQILASGRVHRHRIVIPEGSNIRDIADILESSTLKVNGPAFIAKAHDATLMQRLNVPADNAEGFLFPTTYFFPRRYPIADMIGEMVKNYQHHFTPEFRARATELGWTELQAVAFASIIEKETGRAEERPWISSVFHNRLARGMKLQSDPTTIYGIVDFNGNLTRKDLQTYSPYNTYVIKGIPKGPITNPGVESIKAALYPAQTNYLFFVARGDGTHEFTSTLKDHNQAVFTYQISHRRKAAVNP